MLNVPKAVPLVLANVLIPVAILVFAVGFFPYKPVLPGLAGIGTENGIVIPSAPFDRIVFMVVDALRSDFVFSSNSGFKYTQSLISSGLAIPFTAHATSPTITMPRIKAMTTGSVPSFLDVILNFAESDTTSTLAHQDTWLAQMKGKDNGSLIMYGDDTWLKLFPETFGRVDGTSSFFVSDFTEVDYNVTRHISSELERSDWNTMVMHYLGLDHIGHKAGPRSPNMIPKQREMDAIIKQIFAAIESKPELKNTLLVLCGDHGMNDAGNHGGSAEGETSPALVFASPHFHGISKSRSCPVNGNPDFQYYSTIEQSDIVPTLAALLGFPVPRNNLGVIIPEFLELWNERDQVHQVYRNAHQIQEIVKATFSKTTVDVPADLGNCDLGSSTSDQLSCSWARVERAMNDWQLQKNISTEEITSILVQFSKQAQRIMSSTSSNYDGPKMNVGVTLAVFAASLAILGSLQMLMQAGTSGMWVAGITLSYGVMMFASSFVEEEQQFWYWIASGWLVYIYFRVTHRTKISTFTTISPMIVLGLLRIIRRWNQTGQKFTSEPDIAKTFFRGHTAILWLSVLATYIDITQRLIRHLGTPLTVFSVLLSGSLGFVSLLFKVIFTKTDAPELFSQLETSSLDFFDEVSLVTLARVVFIGLAVAYAYSRNARAWRFNSTKHKNCLQANHDLLTLFLVTQTRATNIPLFLISEVAYRFFDKWDLSVVEVSTISLLFQYLSFFAAGGSNAISSVDLSNAYNGVSGYNVLAVALLTFISNWALPIWWVSATNLLLKKLRGSGKQPFLGYISTHTVFLTTSLAFVMVACSVLRDHLFVWTVFSPKFLYSMAWSFGEHFLINLFSGGIMLSASQD